MIQKTIDMEIKRVTYDNAEQEGFFCIKNKKANGYKRKLRWLKESEAVIFLAKDEKGKSIGFVECVVSEKAWRPLRAKDMLFIHCIMVQSKSDRHAGVGGQLLHACEAEARQQGKAGICVMSSDGSWIADNSLFIRHGFQFVEQRGRFELLYKPLSENATKPVLMDWERAAMAYKGWHLFFADQCPWHINAVEAMLHVAADFDIDLQLHEMTSADQAQQAPSGFGVFALVHNGELLEDHYLSKTRFRTILKKRIKA